MKPFFCFLPCSPPSKDQFHCTNQETPFKTNGVTRCVRKLWVIHSKKITVYKFICNFLSLAPLLGWLALSRKNKTFQGIIKHLGVLSQTQILFHCHWEREERGNLCQQIPVKRKMPRGNKIQILQFRKTQAISSRQLSQREECEELYINVMYE